MKPRQPIIITILIVLGLISGAFFMFTQSSEFFSSAIFWVTLVLGGVVVFINNSLNKLIDIKKYNMLTEEEKEEYKRLLKIPYFQRLKQSAVEKQGDKDEKDMIIDHGFDGILELDNALPKWWLGLFYFGVAYCVIYLTSYAFTEFAHPATEYDLEVAQANIEIEEYWKNAPKITIDNAEYNPDNIAEGKQLFETTCVSCHKEGGAGGIGPNLTDDYWINIKEKGLFKNVFYMVYNGSENNPAMRAFGKDGEIPGRDIEKIAAYVYYINQDIPNIAGGAAPQGEKATWNDAR